MKSTNRAIINVIKRLDARHQPWTVEIDRLFVKDDTIIVGYHYQMHEIERHWFVSFCFGRRRLTLTQATELTQDGEVKLSNTDLRSSD